MSEHCHYAHSISSCSLVLVIAGFLKQSVLSTTSIITCTIETEHKRTSSETIFIFIASYSFLCHYRFFEDTAGQMVAQKIMHKRLITELSRRAHAVSSEKDDKDEFAAFARWIGRKPVSVDQFFRSAEGVFEDDLLRTQDSLSDENNWRG